MVAFHNLKILGCLHSTVSFSILVLENGAELDSMWGHIWDVGVLMLVCKIQDLLLKQNT